jgi:hypothetical protein
MITGVSTEPIDWVSDDEKSSALKTWGLFTAEAPGDVSFRFERERDGNRRGV